MDRDRDRPTEPGATIGLGRVVENPAGLGRDAQPTPEGPLVEEASEDSFPASDPPSFASDKATPGERAITGPDAAGRDAAGSEPGPADAGDMPGTELPDPEERA